MSLLISQAAYLERIEFYFTQFFCKGRKLQLAKSTKFSRQIQPNLNHQVKESEDFPDYARMMSLRCKVLVYHNTRFTELGQSVGWVGEVTVPCPTRY